MLFLRYVVFLMVIEVGFSQAQVTLHYDTLFIKRYYRSLCATLVGQTMEYRLTIHNQNGGKNIVYTSNIPFGVGAELDYKWLSVGYTYSIAHFEQSGNDPYTEVRTLQAGATGRWYWARGFLQSYKGLYLANKDGFSFHPNPENKRNDINGVAFIGNANYIFNKRKYSHKASLWQTEQQLKSAGTFTAGVAINIYSMNADSAILPPASVNEFGEYGSTVKSLSQSYIINGGYLHTFVFRKHGFVHLSVIPGLCLQKNTYTLATSEERERPLNLGAYGEARLTAGYNGPRFYGGINVASYFSSEQESATPVSHSYSFFRVFLGIRIPLKVKVPLEDVFE